MIFGGLFLDDLVGGSGWGLVVRGCGTAVLAFLDAAEATGAAEEDGHFVVEDVFACCFVDGCDGAFDDCCGAFVNDFDELWVGNEGCRGRDGELLDFKVLFSVEQFHRVEVWDYAG